MLSTNMITSFATAATLVFLYLTWKQVREAQEDAERPHVTIGLYMRSDTDRVLFITNGGKSPAIRTRLKLIGVKEGLKVTSQETAKGEFYNLEDNPLFHDGIDLPSGWLYEFLLQRGTTYAEDLEEEKHPRAFTIDIKYESVRGTKYEDSVPISIDAHRYSIVPSATTAEQLGRLRKPLLEALNGIKMELMRIRSSSHD